MFAIHALFIFLIIVVIIFPAYTCCMCHMYCSVGVPTFTICKFESPFNELAQCADCFVHSRCRFNILVSHFLDLTAR